MPEGPGRPRVLVSLLSLRPAALSAVVYARNLLPPLARLVGDDRMVVQCDVATRRALADVSCAFDVVEVADARLARLAAIRRHLPAAVRRGRADVVFAPDVPLLGAPLEVPAVLVEHSHLNLSRPKGQPLGRRLYWSLWFNGAMRRAACRAAALVAPTQAFADEFASLVPGSRERLRVVHHGVSRALRPDDEARPRPVVLAVGSSHAYKNPAGVLRVFEQAARDLPHALRFVGLSQGELDRLAREAGVAPMVRPRLHGLGLVGEDQLAAEYRAASALLFPSHVESFGLPVAEAMASGLPVVASRLPSLVEVSGGAAWHEEASDTRALAAALRTTLTDDGRWRSMRARGLERARIFTWERAAAEVADVLAEAAKTRQPDWNARRGA